MTSEEFSIPDFILILQKEPVLSLLILSAKQRNYLVPFVLRLFYMNPGPPALEASTLPLGDRGGGGL